MDEKELKQKIDKGGILAQVSFEVIGNPKEHVEQSMKSYLERIKQEQNLSLISYEIGTAEAIEGNLWSTYTDSEILFDNLDKFIWLCFNFMPANIDIIAPENLKFKEKDFTNWLNDLLAKLHEITHTVRQTESTNHVLTKGMNTLIQNSVLLAARNYHSAKDIAKHVGISEEQLAPFLDALTEKKKLEKKGKKYSYSGKEA